MLTKFSISPSFSLKHLTHKNTYKWFYRKPMRWALLLPPFLETRAQWSGWTCQGHTASEDRTLDWLWIRCSYLLSMLRLLSTQKGRSVYWEKKGIKGAENIHTGKLPVTPWEFRHLITDSQTGICLQTASPPPNCWAAINLLTLQFPHLSSRYKSISFKCWNGDMGLYLPK